MSMDASEAKRIVEVNVGAMVDALCLHHWRLEIHYTSTGHENWKAKCDRSGSDYFIAELTFDPERHDDEQDLLRSLRHELLHLHLAPFDLYRDLMTQHIDDDDSPQARQEQRAFSHAVEQMVGNLERMLANLDKPGHKLLNTLKGVSP
jgi:hypothetical protein